MFKQALHTAHQKAQRVLIRLISFYQRLLSPLLGSRCRFHPSCSCYSKEAIEHFGVFKGVVMTVWRLLRCHPFNSGGFDPIHKGRPQ